MRLTDDQLLFKALAALSEIVDQSRKAPVPASTGLRFILAWLYTRSKTSDRSVYDEFWQVTQDGMTQAHSDCEGNVFRGSQAQSALNGIARNAGIELTAEYECQMSQARMIKAERLRYRASPHYIYSQRKRSSNAD